MKRYEQAQQFTDHLRVLCEQIDQKRQTLLGNLNAVSHAVSPEVAMGVRKLAFEFDCLGARVEEIWELLLPFCVLSDDARDYADINATLTTMMEEA